LVVVSIIRNSSEKDTKIESEKEREEAKTEEAEDEEREEGQLMREITCDGKSDEAERER